jgi:hypothetical protein
MQTRWIKIARENLSVNVQCRGAKAFAFIGLHSRLKRLPAA